MKPTNDNGAHSFTEGATFEIAENINEFLKEEKTMEAFRLISMTDFVLEIDKEWENPSKPFSENKALMKICNYATFLIQPLQLGMFVPCDENGNVLEEPKRWNDYLQFPDSFDGNKEWGELYDYELAIERILFKGFEYVNFINDGKLLPYHRLIKNDEYFNVRFLDRNIEDLLTEFEYGIELTSTAIKQIGL